MFNIKDPLGFSFEFMWAKPCIGHKVTGYLPSNKKEYIPAENRKVQNTLWVDSLPEQVFKIASNLEDFDQFCRFGPRLNY